MKVSLLILAMSYLILGVAFMILVFRTIRWVQPAIRRKWRLYELPHFNISYHRPRLARLFLFLVKTQRLEAYGQLLLAAGLPVKAAVYVAVKRFIFFTALILFYLLLSGFSRPAWDNSVVLLTGAGMLCALIVLTFDKLWLVTVAKGRSHRITEEIYVICKQLLYYHGSKLNVHAKLVKCLPYTTRLKRDWLLLINEWYEDAEEALIRFKLRLGTDEAYSFAETLNTLRQNEHAGFYELLRQRIKDYKDKIENNKEGRKESFSYVLFVLAGLPIMYTFRVFVHPWVEQGRKMFDILNT